MKTNEGSVYGQWNGFLTVLFLVMLTVAACTNDSDSEFSAEDSEDATNDVLDDSSQDDAEDVGMTALISETSEGGKISDLDDRFQCAVVTRVGDKDAGTIRIDFGSGCKYNLGRTRRGAIVVTYVGVWSVAGSSWSMTFDNYFVNDVNIAGTRTVVNITTDTTRRRFQVDCEDGTATWPDGRIARRRLHHIREHERNTSNILMRLIIYGTAEGNHRNGRGFFIEILEPLVYDRECMKNEGVIIPVKGVKLIKHGNRQITVDYGDGRCDNIVTLINVNGRKKDIRVFGG